MDWQAKLRDLDTRLAEGTIAMPEYRKLRDEILAEASGGAPAAVAPTRVPIPASAATESPSGEMTQVVKRDDPTEVETTEAITPPPRRPTGPPVTAAPAAPAAPPAPPEQPSRPYPWSAPVPGEAVFATAKPKTGSRVLVPLLVLVVLALLGGAVWWFALRSDGTNASPPPATTAADRPAAGPAADIETRLPELPGRPSQHNATMPVQRAVELKLVSAKYAELLRSNGVAELVHRGSVHNGVGYMILVGRAGSPANATTIAGGAHEHLRALGFADVAIDVAGKPAVFARTDPTLRTYGAVYASGDLWVQLSVSGKASGEDAALRQSFEPLLRALLADLPAG